MPLQGRERPFAELTQGIDKSPRRDRRCKAQSGMHDFWQAPQTRGTATALKAVRSENQRPTYPNSARLPIPQTDA